MLLPGRPKKTCSITNIFRSNKKYLLNSVGFSFQNTSLYFQDQTGTRYFPLTIHLPRGHETQCLIQPQHTHDPSIAMASYQELSNLLLHLSSSKPLTAIKHFFFQTLTYVFVPENGINGVLLNIFWLLVAVHKNESFTGWLSTETMQLMQVKQFSSYSLLCFKEVKNMFLFCGLDNIFSNTKLNQLH